MMQRSDRFENEILDAMKAETERIVEEEAKAAALRVESRVKMLAAQLAVSLASQTSFERVGQNLLITVRFPEKEVRP